jgi:hypothetical protein
MFFKHKSMPHLCSHMFFEQKSMSHFMQPNVFRTKVNVPFIQSNVFRTKGNGPFMQSNVFRTKVKVPGDKLLVELEKVSSFHLSHQSIKINQINQLLHFLTNCCLSRIYMVDFEMRFAESKLTLVSQNTLVSENGSLVLYYKTYYGRNSRIL